MDSGSSFARIALPLFHQQHCSSGRNQIATPLALSKSSWAGMIHSSPQRTLPTQIQASFHSLLASIQLWCAIDSGSFFHWILEPAAPHLPCVEYRTVHLKPRHPDTPTYGAPQKLNASGGGPGILILQSLYTAESYRWPAVLVLYQSWTTVVLS
jgi:hypothetical protein